MEGSSRLDSPLAATKRWLSEEPSPSEPIKRAKPEQDTKPVQPEALEPDGEEGPAPEPSSRGKQPGKRDAAGWPKSRKAKEKEGKNVGRRRGTRIEGPREVPGDHEEEGSKVPRLPKRMTALLMGFCGTGCSGMQIQPRDNNIRTIEGVLFDALVRAGAVSRDNADDPTKVNLGRAARTDAGVHAAGNVVSMKLIVNIPGVKDWVARINEELPPEIRIWGKVRVQNGFNARLSCDSRKYTYFFPSYLLIPPKPNSAFIRTQMAAAPPGSSSSDTPRHPFWEFPGAESSSPEEDLVRKRRWRASPEDIAKLRAIVKKFEGTHNFHNFTVGRDFTDRSNQRSMIQIQIAEPAVYGDTEWISVLFHGQSFMLHQRKMMSALVLTCRTKTPSEIIDELYGPRVVLVPKMPALGLLLEYPIFDSYNRKVTTVNEREKYDSAHPDFRPAIDFEQYRDMINIFKQAFIYNDMRAAEDRHGIFDAWVRYVDNYEGNDLLYLNPRGIIPAAALIKKNERRRSKPFKENRRFDVINTKDLKDAPSLEEEVESDEEKLSKPALEDMEG
ncbi:pseudouridine synthase [Paxillus ammoniavirescens]|nr:pseudouridine synthase [Paxillus ammoniavirescens]